MGVITEGEKKKGRIGGSYGSSSRRKTMSEVTKIFCRFAIEEKKKGRIGGSYGSSSSWKTMSEVTKICSTGIAQDHSFLLFLF